MALSHRLVVLHHGEKLTEVLPADVARDRRIIEAYLGEEHAVRPAAWVSGEEGRA